MLWSALRDDYIRIELKDSETDKKWTDAALLSWAKAGMRDISSHMPRRKAATITTISETRGYSLTTALSDRVGAIYQVEHPEGVYLEEINFKPGTSRFYPTLPAYLLTGYTEVVDGWYEMDDTLYLTKDPDTSDDITVWYEGQRDIPSTDASVIDLWDNDTELLVAYVCWKAFLRVGGQDATLSRWSEGGRRDDNPIKPAWRAWQERYLELLGDRTKPSWIRLYRRGRMS